jgi:hypothetical protein
MSNDKLPDYYVENRSLKEYPTEVGAPKFSPDNISLFKQEKTFKLKKHYSSKIEELEKEYKKIIEEIRLNERLYMAKCNFEPVSGNIYHLYDNKGVEFLSLISPSEWKMKSIGSYKFLSDGRWEKVEF